MRVTRTATVVLCALAGAASASPIAAAHDFTSGPRNGFPPKADEARRRSAALVPDGLSEAATRATRGVADQAKLWPQNQTLKLCFLSGTDKARARVATAANEWTAYLNLRLDIGDVVSPRLSAKSMNTADPADSSTVLPCSTPDQLPSSEPGSTFARCRPGVSRPPA